MRIIFMGTPDYAVPVLKAAVEAGHEIVAVYTQPDKPVGRKQILTAPPVKEYALSQNLNVLQPRRVKRPSVVEAMRAYEADLILVAAYGQILSQEILDMPKYGCINLHASLLPKYRGAAPIQRCIVEGETVSGVTAMQMDIGIDTGDMLLKKEVVIENEDTAEDLYEKLSAAAGELTAEVLGILSRGEELHPVPQCHEEATHAPMLSKEDGIIDWSRSAQEIYNQVRGLYPWPAAYSSLNGLKLTIWKAKVTEESSEGHTPGEVIVRKRQMLVAAGDKLLEIVNLQLQGKKQMQADAFLLGNHPEGEILG